MTTSSQRDIENVFLLAAKVCPKCRGSRSLANEDGSYSPCQCVIKEMILKYLGELKRYGSLKSTPLLEPLEKNKDITIEFENAPNLYAHLKTALLHRKIWTKTWKVMTPDEIMSRSFSKEDEQRRELYRTDLLIIIASAFPFYEAAGKQHEYVIKTRKSLGKQTWFCTHNLAELNNRADLKSMTSEFRKLLGTKPIRITESSTRALRKEQKTNTRQETVLELGSSVSEVNRDLVDFDDPVWLRITNYK